MVVRVRPPISSQFSFPRGKLNKMEDPRYGCIREIKEETGFDLSVEQCKEEYSFVVNRKKKGAQMHSITYYVITDVPSTTTFDPKCPEEISEVRWEDINLMEARDEEERTKLKEIISKIRKEKINTPINRHH
ncbi:mRNA-decapping enzyme [Entamoeba marina]